MRKKLGRSINLVKQDAPPSPSGQLVFERQFPAGNEAKNEVLEELLDALQSSGAISGETEQVRMRLCLDEGLVNAVMHGSRHDATKTVSVRAWVSAENWSILIEDQGQGFRDEDLPDPEAPENLLEESGRGVHLMRNMMDSVNYWRGGRSLLLSRKRNTSA